MNSSITRILLTSIMPRLQMSDRTS